MIKVIENTKSRVVIEKGERDEMWFNCSNESLLKFLKREGDIIERVQFYDGKYIGSELIVYFKQ